MNRIGRQLIRAVALSTIVGLAGAASASAWTFATRTTPLKLNTAGTLAGQGAGSLTQASAGSVKLASEMTDNKRNGNRVFIDVYGSSSLGNSTVQTGRRADGEAFWAAMADKYMYGTGIGGYTFRVKLCEDLSGSPDFCTSEKVSTL